MMFVLLAALLLSVVTLGTMRLVAGDIIEGFGGLEAVQAFNVAEAGVHYAIRQLQVAGGSTYTGERSPSQAEPRPSAPPRSP